MGAILDHFTQDYRLSMEVAKAALDGWELRPLKIGETEVGEIMLKNNEVHFALHRSHRLVLGRGKLLRKTLEGLLKEKTFLVSKLFHNSPCKPLLLKIGFTVTHTDSMYEYYWLTSVQPPQQNKRKEVVYDCY